MTTPLIDRAGAADIDQLLPLLESLFSLEKDFEFEPARARTALSQLLSDPGRSCVLVARVQGKVVGMCSAQLVFSTAQGTPSAWVEDVVVASSYRGTGVGELLLAELERWCRLKGVSRMQLVASSTGAA